MPVAGEPLGASRIMKEEQSDAGPEKMLRKIADETETLEV